MDGLNFKHYITTDEQGQITDGWSDGPFPDRDTAGAILLTERGGYQFRLGPDGVENPPLKDENAAPRYRWDGEKITEVTNE